VRARVAGVHIKPECRTRILCRPISFLLQSQVLDTIALTRGQLGTRSLRRGDIIIKLSKTRLHVGRSYRRTTGSLRSRVSIRIDGTQSAVENSTHVLPSYAAYSTHVWCSAPRRTSTSVLHEHEARLLGTIEDPVSRPIASSSLSSFTVPSPSPRPNNSGRIARGDFHEASSYSALSIGPKDVVAIKEEYVGIPKDGA
jgi:hypothetical protein